MPRRNRIHYQHAFYHVMLRGNNQQAVFNDKEDRENFLDAVGNAVKTFNCKIHLFCLMTNHIHLVMEVEYIPLWKIMLSITSRYAKKHNKRSGKVGHLFQGRYRAKLIQNDQYFLELCFYIHSNPVKAKMVLNLDDYPWSSHQVYSGRVHIDWFTTRHINLLLRQQVGSKNYYTKFMNDYNRNKPMFCEFDSSGDLVIKDSVTKKINNKPVLALENVPLRKIASIVCAHLRVSVSELDSSSQARDVTLARSMITYFGHYHAQYCLKDIAGAFCREPDSLSKTLQRHLKNRRNVAQLISTLERKLSVSDTDCFLL